MTLKDHILMTIYQQKNPKPIKILFPEAENEKIQAVTLKLLNEEFNVNNQKIKVSKLITPVLLFKKNETIPSNLKDYAVIVADKEKLKLSQELYQLRKDKGLTLDQAQTLLDGKNYYGMMLLKRQAVDCLVGGINFTTADILRPALQIIKPKPGIKTVSSTFLMSKNQELYLFADGSINIKPTSDQLIDIAKASVDLTQSLNLKAFDDLHFSEIKLALLSYSTNGSGSGEDVDKMHNVAVVLKSTDWGKQRVAVAGEIQFDAAFDELTRKKKFPELSFSGPCNVYIFPDLNASNIGYKIAQRLGGYQAIGPVILGLNQPVNDLSRGATIDDIFFTSLVACVQVQLKSGFNGGQ
ncbi:MAG: phosphotransacetylase [Spiroplasma sp.]|nr:phosphotransacetylase [Spiroplasma sp.]